MHEAAANDMSPETTKATSHDPTVSRMSPGTHTSHTKPMNTRESKGRGGKWHAKDLMAVREMLSLKKKKNPWSLQRFVRLPGAILSQLAFLGVRDPSFREKDSLIYQ